MDTPTLLSLREQVTSDKQLTTLSFHTSCSTCPHLSWCLARTGWERRWIRSSSLTRGIMEKAR